MPKKARRAKAPLKVFYHHAPRPALKPLAAAVRRTLRAERVPGPGELHIVFVSDPEIRRLNRKFHNADKVTDVLAFSYAVPRANEPSSHRANDLPWADVYVSKDRARIQGPRYGHTFLEELIFLAIHGILHVLGYRDARPKERAKMWRRQESLLKGPQ